MLLATSQLWRGSDGVPEYSLCQAMMLCPLVLGPSAYCGPPLGKVPNSTWGWSSPERLHYRGTLGEAGESESVPEG